MNYWPGASYGTVPGPEDEDLQIAALLAELDDEFGLEEESDVEEVEQPEYQEEVADLEFADIEEALERKQLLEGRRFTSAEITGIWKDANFQWRNAGVVDVDTAFETYWKLQGREPYDLTNSHDGDRYAIELYKDREAMEKLEREQGEPEDDDRPEFVDTAQGRADTARWMAERVAAAGADAEGDEEDGS